MFLNYYFYNCTAAGMVFGGLWYDFAREVWRLHRFAWRELDSSAPSASHSRAE